MRKATKIKRMMQLRMLGKKLLKVPEHAFDLSTWRANILSGKDLEAPAKMSCECGFVACAIGWFPILVPEVSKAGFKVGPSENPSCSSFASTTTPRPVYRGYEQWSAIVMYFDLNGTGEAYHLFSPDEYPLLVGTKQVSERIIKFANKALRELRA